MFYCVLEHHGRQEIVLSPRDSRCSSQFLQFKMGQKKQMNKKIKLYHEAKSFVSSEFSPNFGNLILSKHLAVHFAAALFDPYKKN